MRLGIRLTVAPRHLFRALWSPSGPALQREAARRELIDFITEGWDSLDIEATTTHVETGHSVPPTVSGRGSADG